MKILLIPFLLLFFFIPIFLFILFLNELFEITFVYKFIFKNFFVNLYNLFMYSFKIANQTLLIQHGTPPVIAALPAAIKNLLLKNSDGNFGVPLFFQRYIMYRLVLM